MSHQSSAVQFLGLFSLQGMTFNPLRKDGLKFRCLGSEVDIEIKPRSEFNFAQLDGRIRYSLPASSEQCQFISSLICGKYVRMPDSPISIPFVFDKQQKIDADGLMEKGFPITQELLPENIQSLCTTAIDEMAFALNRFIKLLRWRQDIEGPPQPIEHGITLYWKVAEDVYHCAPFHKKSFETSVPLGIRWKPEDEEQFADVWADNELSEPLAHELLREAEALAGTAGRSALLVGFSALESGVKRHLSKVLPNAAWLISELPAPPVPKLLARFLPQVHAGNRDIADWNALKPLWKICQEMMEKRNALTHTGQMPEEVPLDEYLRAVHDVLYILDVLEGHEWAKGLVYRDTLKALGWVGSVARTSLHISSRP